MDAISAGATAAFAIECYQRGILTSADTDGLELRWGDGQALLELARRMTTREGIGDLLADGSRMAALHLGGSAMQIAVHAGGQELAMHDSRGDPGFALHAVVEPAPGRHTTGSQLYYEMYRLWTRVPDLPRVKRLFFKGAKYRLPEEKARMAAACSRFAQVMNSAGICLFATFLGVDRLPIFEWLNAVAGWDRSPADYMLIGERIQTLRQAFNARQGIPLRHEINPRALGIPLQTRGANRGRSVDLDELVPLYWAQMGWDIASGTPTPETMRRLGLDELAMMPQYGSKTEKPSGVPSAKELPSLAQSGQGSMQQSGEINGRDNVHDSQAEQAQPDGDVYRVPDRQHTPRGSQ
jgi:aldehyde:ferredoxin oxidoreductase